MLTRLAGLADDDMWRQAGRWLSGREAGAAAEELLAAAAIGSAAQRVVAVDVVAGLGEPTLPAWRRALEDPMLAPHARSVLADLGGGPAPDLADRRGWRSSSRSSRSRRTGRRRRTVLSGFTGAAVDATIGALSSRGRLDGAAAERGRQQTGTARRRETVARTCRT